MIGNKSKIKFLNNRFRRNNCLHKYEDLCCGIVIDNSIDLIVINRSNSHVANKD
jgi:hypothetical protein